MTQFNDPEMELMQSIVGKKARNFETLIGMRNREILN